MNVRIEVIPHAKQRYNTLGDWLFEGDDLVIRVSASGDWRSDMLVAIHELVEVVLCKADGVTQEVVDAFDMSHPDSEEPGDEPNAPYRDQHCHALAVERMVAAAMKYSWQHHDDITAGVSLQWQKD